MKNILLSVTLANFAAAHGAAVIVHQHEPGQNTLRETLKRVLKHRLSGKDTSTNYLVKMQEGMQSLAVRDAQGKLVEILNRFG